MTFLEQVKMDYEKGFPIFEKLFNKSSEEIREILRKNLLNHNSRLDEYFFNHMDIVKTSKNDIPNKIECHFYDSISINFLGITFEPEHGYSHTLISFTEGFEV